MTRRPAVTLIEVLIAMFIMAIGMLALLVLFPLGAISMGQALKDDRCASTASMAENVAMVMPTPTATTPGGIRHDPGVTSVFAGPPATTLLYVDPYGILPVPPLGKLGGVIPRISPDFLNPQTPPQPYVAAQLAAVNRWFSLPDDIGFCASGTPDTSNTGGLVDRGRRYSYAYLLRQLAPNLIQLYVVVYIGRPVNTLTAENTVSATGTVGANNITVNAIGTTLKRGGWVLDPVNGIFYRVTNFAETVISTTTTVDLQTNLIYPVTQVTIMDNVAEVFDKGTSWQP